MTHIYSPLPGDPLSEKKIYFAPHLKHPLILPWHDAYLWLSREQICALYMLHSWNFRQFRRGALETLNRHLDDFCENLPVKKGGRRLHDIFHRYDLVVEIGRRKESKYLEPFEKWAKGIGCA